MGVPGAPLRSAPSGDAQDALPLGWHSHDDTPEPETKIVALYLDGSGAKLLYVHADGFLNAEGDDVEWDFWSWAYLDQRFLFWCEIRSDDPMSLPVQRTLGPQVSPPIREGR